MEVLPVFDLQGGAALAVPRGIAVTALLSAFGTTVFRVAVAPKAGAAMPPALAARCDARLGRIVQGSALAAIAGLAVWLVAQAWAMADATSFGAAIGAVPAVLGKTAFGHTIILQLASLAVLTAIAFAPGRGAWRYPAVAASGVALSLQAGHSHAYSMWQGPSLLLACDVLHLLGAGAWLGGLVPLLLLVRDAPAKAAGTAARWFSPVGQASIVALVVSAAIQGWSLVGSVPGLIGTAYGWMVLVKSLLFGVLFALAWCNRYRFAPGLLRAEPDRARRVLLRSLALQTLFAGAIIVAAIILSDLPPAMHLQALWPFAQRFSLAAIEEDPDFYREVVEAGAALAASVALLLLALAISRLRLAAAAMVIVVAWFALPHFDLLLVTAYPTSFYHSPSGFTTASIADGGALFAVHCVSCHGQNGAGDGALAKTLPVPPADLTAAHLWMHSDGELFWWLSDGIATPDQVQAMPGFSTVLDEDSRWALIDYIRAHNAGVARQQTGAWTQPVKAPDFGLQCENGSMAMSDLRGRFVRVVFGATPPDASAVAGVTTIVAAPPGGAPSPGGCVTGDETVRRAYAIVSGMAASSMTGMAFIVDPDGWLRAMQPAQGPGNWNDPAALAAEIAMLRGHKIAADAAPDAMTMPMPMKMPMTTPMKMPM